MIVRLFCSRCNVISTSGSREGTRVKCAFVFNPGELTARTSQVAGPGMAGCQIVAMRLTWSTERCLQCKGANTRCDKLRPSCGACVKRKGECWYVDGPKSNQTQTQTHATIRSGVEAQSRLACLQCMDAKIDCDMRRPSCSSCLEINTQCCYVGVPSHQNAHGREGSGSSDFRTTPVLRELCFVGQRFGAWEMALLSTYVEEISCVVRAPLSFIKQAWSPIPVHDGRTWATSITPHQAASHATGWAALCVGAVLRRNENADVYLGNAIEAARLCYDVPCKGTLTAMVAIAYAAFLICRAEVLSLFAGYVEILSAELPSDTGTIVQVRYLRSLLQISSLGVKPTSTIENHHLDQVAATPIQALSVATLESACKVISMVPFQYPLPIERVTVVKEEICKLERSLAIVMQNRVAGDHAEIHNARTQLLLLHLWAGERHKIIPLAKEVVEISCMHPKRLHTRHWHTLAVSFSKYLFSCGEIETATKMWSHLNRFRPLNVGTLGSLAEHAPTGTDGTGEGSDMHFMFALAKPLMYQFRDQRGSERT